MGPRAGLDDVEKRKLLTLLGLELRLLGCPVCSQSLYQLCYLGSSGFFGKNNKKKLQGFSPPASYTNRATVACRRS
jgi:hypothetical protein